MQSETAVAISRRYKPAAPSQLKSLALSRRSAASNHIITGDTKWESNRLGRHVWVSQAIVLGDTSAWETLLGLPSNRDGRHERGSAMRGYDDHRLGAVS